MKRVINIIKSLGGASEVAAKLKTERSTVYSWHFRGFPKARTIEIVELAESRGVSLTFCDVHKAVPEEREPTQ